MAFLSKKILYLLLVAFMVSLASFLLVDRLPADIAYELAGFDASVADVAAIRAELGLDDPVTIRYGRWLVGVLRGDLGISLHNREPVRQALAARLPVTLELLLLAQLLAVLLAVPAGIFCAWRAESRTDRILNALAFGSLSVPNFVMAMLLILVFAITLGWFPATGFTPFATHPWRNLQGMLLPALAIALAEWVPLMRALRGDMIQTLQEDYILLARAQGLSTGRILFRHALRPSSFTFVTVFGLQVGRLLGGALIVETVFALPGIGRLLVQAIFAQDSTVIQGCVLLITCGYLLVNVLVDLGYGLLDPRLSLRGRHG